MKWYGPEDIAITTYLDILDLKKFQIYTCALIISVILPLM